jgi:hypothetical protein
MKSIVVVLKPEAARALHGMAARAPGGETVDVGGLTQVAESLGIQLTPTHPNAQHEMLLPYFTASAVPDDRAQAVVEALRMSPLVDAAYVQPTAAPAQE